MLLAFTVNSFVYFGFVNSYSSKILNFQDFTQQFHSGIYQYRILSGHFLIWIYDFLGNFNVNYDVFKMKFLNPNSEPRMYLSLYILNTLFLMLSAFVLLLITQTKNFIASESERILIVAVSIFAIALSQFVIVPYDVSSYFFLLLFFFFLMKYLENQSALNLITLFFILTISTLNRESSALSISLAATLLLAKFGWTKKMMVPVAILATTFIAVYIGMRIFSEKFVTNDGSLITENLTNYKNWLGILFWVVFFIFTLLLATQKQARKNIIIFHFLALPYIAMCFYTGILYEIRLYIPIFITCLFLGGINFQTKKPQSAEF